MAYTFKNSPVSELVFGVQYEGPAFNINDEIEIFEIFRKDFPQLDEVPPLPSIIERTDALQTQRILNNWSSRKHFISSLGDRLIQIQPDRLLFNWRKGQSENIYPRFKNVFPAFVEIVERVDKKMGKVIDRNQYEMTYFDHILLSSFALDEYELGQILKLGQSGSIYKNISIEYSIAHPELGGALNVSLKSAIRRDSKEKLLVMENTCRGFDLSMDIIHWFQMAHNVLLEHFSVIATDRAKTIWGFTEE